MHTLLEKILRKRGIKDISELQDEEKATFDNWKSVLGKDELTVDDIKTFCASQVELIETRWKDYALENAKKAELIPYHTVYKTLLTAIDSPKVAKEALERQLIELTK